IFFAFSLALPAMNNTVQRKIMNFIIVADQPAYHSETGLSAIVALLNEAGLGIVGGHFRMNTGFAKKPGLHTGFYITV
ncbi:MAG TPA: hypothetical protein VFO70_01185, partial [Chitinophagaceae bacterium]|nr:hypothetical protein [Chitinophagaceae bacterium]